MKRFQGNERTGMGKQAAGNGYWDTAADEADKTTACAGIKCGGDLLIDGGALTILSTGTGGKGISVDGEITINGGTLDITTTGKTYAYNSLYASFLKFLAKVVDKTL
jgi:hypothetical protein